MNRAQHRAVAGALLVAVPIIMLLGTEAAAAFYPGYSTTTQTISALGDVDAPVASQLAFNGSIVLSGVLVAIAAYSLHELYGHRPLTAMVLVVAIPGMVAVGVFPAETGLPHALAAVCSFAGTGITALVAANALRDTYRYVSAALGVLILTTFVLFATLGGGTPLGVGGLERWVFFLTLTWTSATGGYLLAPRDSATLD